LPWQGLKAATKRQKYEKISEKKMSTPIELLCKGHSMEFVTYFQYCRALRFEDKPDYSYLRKLFRDLFAREGYQWDYVFDWTILKHQQTQQIQRGISQTREQEPGLNDEQIETTHGTVPTTSSFQRPTGAQENRRRLLV